MQILIFNDIFCENKVTWHLWSLRGHTNILETELLSYYTF